jgi:hypothetical protein
MEFINHQKGNLVRDDNGEVKWEPDKNGQFTLINEPGFRRIDPTPLIDPEAGKPIEERAYGYDSYLMSRKEAYKTAAHTIPDFEQRKNQYKTLILGTRLQRFARWFKGLFSYLRIDWIAKKNN